MPSAPQPPEPANARDSWATPGRFSLLLGLVLTGFFFPVLIGGRSFFYRDYGVLGYPVIAYARDCFWRGEMPLWNPLSNCGAPFLAQWGVMPLYPFSLIYLLLPLPWSLDFFCVLHLFWGGLGAYWLVRQLTTSPLSAAFAGVLFAVNGVTLSCLIWPNYMVALGWMPWVVVLTLQSSRMPGVRIVQAAVASALQLLAGVPELVVLTWLLILFLLAIQSESRCLAAMLRTGVVVLLAAGLIACQVLPFWQLLHHSQREVGFATDRWSIPIWGLGNFLEPLFHCFKTPEGIFFQPGQEFINSYYFTLIGLALAGLNLQRPRQRLALPLLGSLVLFIALSMGDEARLFKWLRHVFPMLSMARYPAKFMLITVLIMPVLAALGLDRFLDAGVAGSNKSTRALTVWSVAILVALGLTLYRASANPFYYDQIVETWHNGLVRALFLAGAFAALMLFVRLGSSRLRAPCWLVFMALTIGDLGTSVPWQNPSLPNSDFTPGAWAQATQLSPPKLGEGRVFIRPAAEDRLLHSAIKDLESDYLGKRVALWSNLHLIEGIPKVNGSSTLQIREESQVLDLIYHKPRHDLPQLLDFLGAAYVDGSVDVLEWSRRPSAMPVITAGQSSFFSPDPLGAWVKGFDPRKTVCFPESLRREIGDMSGTTARIDTVSFAAERIQFHCTSTDRCIINIAQTAYPAWRAYMDGNAIPIWTANHAFQALVAPPGDHDFLLVYEDAWFHCGLWISGCTLIICVGLSWRWRRKRG